MLRQVDKHSGIPVYIQILNMIKSEIILGKLKPGDQIPTVRELKEIFDVNLNTVLKALEKLKNEGYLESRPGIGYFVNKSISINKNVLDDIKNCVSKLKSSNIDLYTFFIILEEVWNNELK
ncbi:MAG: hypothetical protein PWP54_821 [Thermosipho sp. (in: thermotogales)]|nr:hypothetical protein [Thermosipho sp. (in: thermotogales)]MDN5324911.1 hypothetical protein [Thermosipho sp. (in: thermotogales)]